MPNNLHLIITNSSVSPPPISNINGQDGQSDRQCHGVWYDALLVVSAVLFVVYLAVNAKKNVNKLRNGRSLVLISYYALLWLASGLNLAWCSLQAWQCASGKEIAWNLLSLITTSGFLCLELSLVGFLLQESYANGLEALARTFTISGIIVGVDMLLKAIFIFGFGVPLFLDVGSTHQMKWGLWIIQKLLLTTVYGFILFVPFSKWREKLPPRPAFYNYVAVMFVVNAISLLACGLATIGIGFGIWVYNLTVICYHLLYLPFLYITFLADFFQEEDFLLDNAYYSEMKDAGFFDADWD
ncbi:transmembrane protein adipocyte-associated 1 homolog [Herrania umbratica]|uniref:Transmembrane protein adipocyte-associated 1 homolog n=1 Tax=Herrania umbratica TaxID=108875 RepID=A0A6J1AI00_9ROSI|nr:transmembrane protein adipocyte-associated 1 homolog [Herrania umbratica]XP_021286234.1 transmembrane protein adipocyte-associated 1 homolog [Herrania umbratica]